MEEGQVRGREDRLLQEAGALRPACLNGKLLIFFRRRIVIAADGIESHRFRLVFSSPGAREGRCPPQLEPGSHHVSRVLLPDASSASSPHWEQSGLGTAAMIHITPPPHWALCATCSVFLPDILAVGIP